ncbi:MULTISPECIES: murein tripeptide amidase MpaA [Vibrio]|uniref:murein tripeptide amidase MpaA n=1 Tax=Vibrio TaxID=662 RepID=UPI003D0A9C16
MSFQNIPKQHTVTVQDNSKDGCSSSTDPSLPLTTRIPRPQRAQFLIQPEPFGHSVYNAPLQFFPTQIPSRRKGLIIAGTHGDETGSVAALSAALRSMRPEHLRHDVVLSINPDGHQLGTRANANQVDLNRAFPTQNWCKNGTVYRWTTNNAQRDVNIRTGQEAILEPEIAAIIHLIETRKPHFVVSLHEPLACVDDPEDSLLGRWLSTRFQLPLVTDIGYDTPGSFGSWCKEQTLPCITLEFPNLSSDQLTIHYLESLISLLQYNDKSA